MRTIRSAAFLACLTFACGCVDGDGVDIASASCRAPAPVVGKRVEKSTTPSYIVSFREHVDTAVEANRLARTYGFSLETVFTIIPAFSARVDDRLLDNLRCEPSVASLEYAVTDAPPPAR
jgi:hypothetical protein